MQCLNNKTIDGQVYAGAARKVFNSVPYRRYEIIMRKSWRTGTSVNKTCQQFAAVHRFQEAFFKIYKRRLHVKIMHLFFSIAWLLEES
jgi:hypothetical protein